MPFLDAPKYQKHTQNMSEELKTIVREKYTEIATRNSGCCSPSCCGDKLESSFSDSYEHLEGYVADADLGLGCGIPTEYAGIRPGETVLDLGSGAGNDVFIARQLTGESGRVIGLDMTEAMLEKANANKAKLGYRNVEFVLGDIEAMPLPDNSIDVAVSNCVMNLVPDKGRAYAELFRVLRPGGRFSISDIVIAGDLPGNVRKAAELYAGCVSGAMQKEAYLSTIRQTGFRNVRLAREKIISLPDDLLLHYLDAREVADFRKSGTSIYSVNVCGEK